MSPALEHTLIAVLVALVGVLVALIYRQIRNGRP